MEIQRLDSLEAVYGTLYLVGSNLKDLEDFGRLRIVDELHVQANDSLVTLGGMDDLEYIGNAVIVDNPQLTECAIEPICDFLERSEERAGILWNGSGCNSDGQVRDACSLILGTQDITQSEISVYPNPTSGIVTILDQSNRDFEVRCYSLDGTHINSSRLGVDNQIDLSDFSDRIYILEVDDGKSRQSFRVVKQ